MARRWQHACPTATCASLSACPGQEVRVGCSFGYEGYCTVGSAYEFSLVDISATISSGNKFDGAALVGTLVVFSPSYADCVGTLAIERQYVVRLLLLPC